MFGSDTTWTVFIARTTSLVILERAAPLMGLEKSTSSIGAPIGLLPLAESIISTRRSFETRYIISGTNFATILCGAKINCTDCAIFFFQFYET